MKKKSSIFSFLVGSLTSWCSENSSAMSMSCRDIVGLLQPCLREWNSHMMSPSLKSPPKQTVMPFWMFILGRDSRRLSMYSVD